MDEDLDGIDEFGSSRMAGCQMLPRTRLADAGGKHPVENGRSTVTGCAKRHIARSLLAMSLLTGGSLPSIQKRQWPA